MCRLLLSLSGEHAREDLSFFEREGSEEGSDEGSEEGLKEGSRGGMLVSGSAVVLLLLLVVFGEVESLLFSFEGEPVGETAVVVVGLTEGSSFFVVDVVVLCKGFGLAVKNDFKVGRF